MGHLSLSASLLEASRGAGNGEDFSGELLRELLTALGTAKWQLEELDRAVRSSDEACSAGEDTKTQHSQFVAAIGNQILLVENSLRELTREGGEAMAWVQLDEGERDELAPFLSCPLAEAEKVATLPSVGEVKVGGKKGGEGARASEGGKCQCLYWSTEDFCL